MKDKVKMTIYLRNKDNPVKSSEIEHSLGITGGDLRIIINELRQERIPIGSCMDGYFFARSRSELQSTIDSLEGREIKIRKARHGLEDCFASGDQLNFL